MHRKKLKPNTLFNNVRPCAKAALKAKLGNLLFWQSLPSKPGGQSHHPVMGSHVAWFGHTGQDWAQSCP